MKRPARPALGVSLALALLAARAEGMQSVEIVGIAPQGTLAVERRQLPYAVQLAGAPRQGESLGEAMERALAGVNVNDVAGSPYQNDVTYRGFRASPVLGTAQGLSVYLDGVRVNEPFGDVVNWDMLPEAAIGKLLLAPGSNPLYGLNTLGGALVLSTRSGLSDPGLSLAASSTSHGRRRLDAAFGAYDDSGWHSFAAASLFHDRGWRDDSRGRLGNLYAKAGRQTAAREWDIALLAGGSRLVGNGLLPDGLYEARRSAVYTSPDRTRNQLRQVQGRLLQRLGARTELAWSLYGRSSRRDSVNGDIADAYADWLEQGGDEPPAASLNTAATRQRSQGASLTLQHGASAHRLALGATFDRSSVSFAQYRQAASLGAQRQVLGLPEGERELEASVDGTSSAAALFASDTWTLAPAWFMTFSGRYGQARVANTLRHEVDEGQRERFTYRRFNPAFGIAHEAGKGLTWFANAAQSNRVPTVIELGCADPQQPCRLPVGLQSDPYLKQVVASTLEAGVRWQAGNDQAALALYRTVNRDDILFRSAGLTQHGYFANFPRTRHQGADLSARWRRGTLDLRLAYSYLDATYDAGGSLFTGGRDVPIARGTRMAGLPRHTLKWTADWHASEQTILGASVMALSGMTVQGNEDSAQPDWRIAGHALLSLHATWRPAAKWEAFLRVNNVANRRYESFGAVAADFFPGGSLLRTGQAEDARFVAPGAPRTVAAGLHFSF